jgi:hypothetical protein
MGYRDRASVYTPHVATDYGGHLPAWVGHGAAAESACVRNVFIFDSIRSSATRSMAQAPRIG